MPPLFTLEASEALPLSFPFLTRGKHNCCPPRYVDFIHDPVALYSFVIVLLTTALRTQKHLSLGWKGGSQTSWPGGSTLFLKLAMLGDTDCKIICNEISRPQKGSRTPAWLIDTNGYVGSHSRFMNSSEEPVLFDNSTFVKRPFLIKDAL